jgi:hypothetical protein
MVNLIPYAFDVNQQRIFLVLNKTGNVEIVVAFEGRLEVYCDSNRLVWGHNSRKRFDLKRSILELLLSFDGLPVKCKLVRNRVEILDLEGVFSLAVEKNRSEVNFRF